MGILRKRLSPRLWPLYLAAAVFLVWSAPTLGSLALGGVLVGLGEGLRLWATGHLHKNEALTTTGPYAFLRHPLYLGTLVVVTGLCVTAHSVVCFVLYGVFLAFFAGYYMPYKNRIEGARLESLYGDAFRRYAIAVPSLVPRLHAYVPLASDASPTPEWRSERFLDNNEIGTAVAVGLVAVVMVARWALA